MSLELIKKLEHEPIGNRAIGRPRCPRRRIWDRATAPCIFSWPSEYIDGLALVVERANVINVFTAKPLAAQPQQSPSACYAHRSGPAQSVVVHWPRQPDPNPCCSWRRAADGRGSDRARQRARSACRLPSGRVSGLRGRAWRPAQVRGASGLAQEPNARTGARRAASERQTDGRTASNQSCTEQVNFDSTLPNRSMPNLEMHFYFFC
jgi:hypothetical protein